MLRSWLPLLYPGRPGDHLSGDHGPVILTACFSTESSSPARMCASSTVVNSGCLCRLCRQNSAISMPSSTPATRTACVRASISVISARHLPAQILAAMLHALRVGLLKGVPGVNQARVRIVQQPGSVRPCFPRCLLRAPIDVLFARQAPGDPPVSAAAEYGIQAVWLADDGAPHQVSSLAGCSTVPAITRCCSSHSGLYSSVMRQIRASASMVGL